MHADPRGLLITTESERASVLLEDAVTSFLGQRADTGDHLSSALAADPGLVMAHCLRGFGQLLAARAPLAEAAPQSLESARAATLSRGCTQREAALVSSLAAWSEDGDMWRAAELLERALLDEPLDILALRLAHAIRFMLGDAVGMRLALEAALPAWREGTPGRGFVLGCHAFALEETGDAEAAEYIGREAVALEHGDLWGAHAVAHAMDVQGRAREGIAWIAWLEPHLKKAGGFSRHLQWHRALFHIQLRQPDAALDLYDNRIRDECGEEVRDAINAASLLWRLQARGVEVGARRWHALAEIAARRVGEHRWAFADLHHVIALAAAGRWDALAAMLQGINMRALVDTDTQARIYAEVGLPAARGVATAIAGTPAEAFRILLPLRQRLGAMGGSHAQRDTFYQIITRAEQEMRATHRR